MIELIFLPSGCIKVVGRAKWVGWFSHGQNTSNLLLVINRSTSCAGCRLYSWFNELVTGPQATQFRVHVIICASTSLDQSLSEISSTQSNLLCITNNLYWNLFLKGWCTAQCSTIRNVIRYLKYGFTWPCFNNYVCEHVLSATPVWCLSFLSCSVWH